MNLAVRTVFVAGALVLGAALFETLDSGASTGPGTIRITDRQTSFERVDVGKRGRSAGDMEIENALVYNRRITPRALGHIEFVCTFTVGLNRNCRGTLFMPRGKIVVGGTMRYRQFYELAVLGGTGIYDNARGTMTVTRTARKPPRHILFFRLVG
jgi:hypothetical protein